MLSEVALANNYILYWLKKTVHWQTFFSRDCNHVTVVLLLLPWIAGIVGVRSKASLFEVALVLLQTCWNIIVGRNQPFHSRLLYALAITTEFGCTLSTPKFLCHWHCFREFGWATIQPASTLQIQEEKGDLGKAVQEARKDGVFLCWNFHL